MSVPKDPTTSCDDPIPLKRGWLTHHNEAGYVWIPVLKPEKGKRQLYLEVTQEDEADTMYYKSLLNTRELCETDVIRLLDGRTGDCW